MVTRLEPCATPGAVTCGATPSSRACTPQRTTSTPLWSNCIGAQSITKKAVFEDPSTKRAGRRRSVGVSPRRLASDDAGPDLGHGSTTGDRGRSSGRARLRLHRRVSWHHAVSFCSCLAAAWRRAWIGSGCRSLGSWIAPLHLWNNQVGVGPGDLMVQEPRAAVETTAVAAVHQRPVPRQRPPEAQRCHRRPKEREAACVTYKYLQPYSGFTWASTSAAYTRDSIGGGGWPPQQ